MTWRNFNNESDDKDYDERDAREYREEIWERQLETTDPKGDANHIRNSNDISNGSVCDVHERTAEVREEI